MSADRDLAERLLAASPGIVIRAVEQTSLGVTLSDRNGKIVYANRAEAEMHGFEAEELLGRQVAELGDPDSKHGPEAGERTGSAWVRRRANRRKDGSVFPVRLVSDDIHDEAGDFLGRVTISEDISEPARLERMKEDFVTVVRHELRTPLTSILVSLSLLDRAALPAREREAVAIAERNSRHLLGLVEDLFDLQKAVSGELRVESVRVPVVPTLREAAERAARERPGRGAERRERIVVDVGAEPAAEPASVLADPHRLLQVLDRLLDNALRFSPVSQPVHLGAERDAASTTLTVRDEGPGIPDRLRRRLFEPFTLADASTTRRGAGPGLGLALSKALVECMGGELEIAPHPEAGRLGTTVRVRFPNG